MSRPLFEGIKAVLFDLDGTLINSQAAVFNSWITMANEAGIPLEALAGHHGVPAEQTLRKVLAGREEAEIQKWIRRVTDLEIADVDGVHAVPGALELLAELNDREIPWTIVTSCIGCPSFSFKNLTNSVIWKRCRLQ